MKKFTELQRQERTNIIEAERKFYDQEAFDGMSVEEKVGICKDYLFLQTRTDGRYSRKDSRRIYDAISDGSHKLDEILETLVSQMKDGGSCVRELQSRFMKEVIFENVSGTVSRDAVADREDYISSVKSGNTADFHRMEERAEEEESAEKLGKLQEEAGRVEEGLHRAEEEIDRRIRADQRSGDLDYVIGQQKDAAEFARSLDAAEDAAAVDEGDEIRELFPENVYEEARQMEREDRRRRFVNALEHDGKQKNSDHPEVDILEEELDDLEREFPAVSAELNLSEEARREESRKKEDADKLARELDQADKEGEKRFDDQMVEELFHTEHPVEPAPEQEKKSAEEFLKELDEKVEEEQQKVDPEVEKREASYREVDRIEQLCQDQEEFEKLSAVDKMKIAKSYLLHNGRISPDIADGYEFRLQEGIDSYELGECLHPLCDHVKSGENFLNELNSWHIRSLAYSKAMPKVYSDANLSSAEDYKRKVYAIADREKRDYSKFGTYNGKPKKEKSAEEKEAEELGSLFPENDEVKEEEKRKNREAEERIQRKKDERQRILSERAAEKERREKTGEAKAVQDFLQDKQRKMGGFDTRTEEEKNKAMTAQEAKQLARKIKLRLCGPDFKTMENAEKKKLARTLLFCRGKMNPDEFGLVDVDAGSEEEKTVMGDLQSGLRKSFALDNALSTAISTVKSGREFYQLVNDSPYLKHCIHEYMQEESLYGGNLFNVDREKKEFEQKIRGITERRKKESEIRKNPKKAGKSLENYIILHTGASVLKKEKKPEELFGDLTKAVAAVRLQREGAGFDREKIHASAKRLAERIPASKAKDPRFVKSMKEALVDRSSLEAFMEDMNVATFHIDAKKMDSYRKDMKRILDAMEDPKKRSPEYQKMYQCMSAIVKLDTRGMDESTREEMERKFSRANEDLFDALQNYTRDKEKVRFWDSGKDRFNHSLDALATVAAYAPGAKLATMKFIDRINQIRKQDDPLPRNTEDFIRRYGAGQAAKKPAQRKAELKKPVPKQTHL